MWYTHTMKPIPDRQITGVQVAERLAELRRIGWTITALAEELEINRETISRWSRLDPEPGHCKLALLALSSKIFSRPPKGAHPYRMRRLAATAASDAAQEPVSV